VLTGVQHHGNEVLQRVYGVLRFLDNFSQSKIISLADSGAERLANLDLLLTLPKIRKTTVIFTPVHCTASGPSSFSWRIM